MHTPAIRTVIFDLGGVYFSDGTKQFIGRMTEEYGIAEQKLKDVVEGELGRQYRTAELSPTAFWSAAKRIWSVNIDTQTLASLWFEEYRPIDGTAELIERLNKAGYEVLFLSDNASDRVEYLEARYKFLFRFKAGVFSHLMKTRKPDRKMYDAVLKLASSPASQCVYIDDKPHFLEPAKAMGFHTILFKSPSQIEEELKKLGLKF